LRKFEQFQRMAEIYYAYQQIHRFVVEPFTEHLPDTLFNASRFLLHSIMKEPQIPTGISKLYALIYSIRCSWIEIEDDFLLKLKPK
jgi:intraflagellar transport protein 122